MLPNKEDEKWHKAFYNDIRSNNIKNLEKLINEWPHKLEELDEVLAKAYEELKLKNVLLQDKTKALVESYLLDFRFFSDTSRHDQSISVVDVNNTMERIQLTVESSILLKTDYSNTKKVDGRFIFLAKFIAKNIHILKHQMKSAHDKLPWEQMEFCLVAFIASYTKRQEINLFYRAILNKKRILHHIESFINKLEVQKGKLQSSKHEQEVTKIINSCPQFEELYKDNQQIREVQSLVKISDHIKTKVLVANPVKKDGQLIITKALKLIGEHLEFSKNSTSDHLLQSFQENTRKIIVDLSNSLLLANSLSARIEKEKSENLNFLVNVHNDIKKVGAVINNILDELTEATSSNGKKTVDQNKLISLQGFKLFTSEQDQNSKGDNGSNNKIKPIQLVIQSINAFKVVCSNTEEVEKIIFGAKFLAQKISQIRRELKLTHDRLYWEELEFCLGSFVTSYTKMQEMNPFYRALLNKIRILSHLENFAKKLEDENSESKGVVKKNDSLEFEELYKDYQQVRDVNSLKKMSDRIDLALSEDLDERNGQLIITRVLQFIGEHLKNTPESPKLSDAVSELLLLSLQGTARRIIIELRDFLSHDDNDSISKRIEIEKNTDDNFFLNVKNDIKKVGDVITDILYNNQIDTIRILLNQIVASKNSDEIKDIAEILKMVEFYKIKISENVMMMEHEKLEKLVNELKDNILDKTDSEKHLFNEIDSEMKSARSRSRSENLRSGYLKRYVTLKYHLNDTLTLVKFDNDRINLIKTNAKIALESITSNVELLRWKKISDLSRKIFNIYCARNPCNIDQVCNVVDKICYTCEFETGTIKWIENFREKLNEKCSLTPTKEERNTQENISDVAEEKYNNLLKVKLSELDKILVLTEDLSLYESDKEKAVVEMFLLDIMAILDNLKNYLENNLLFLDDNAPLLYGKCLRNHLAHDNVLFDVLCDPSTAVILNARMFVNYIIIGSQTKIGKVIKDDPFKLRQKYNRDLFIITNQERLFVALEEGNLEAVKDCLNKGADVNARSINLSTTLYFAVKGPSLEVVKYILDQFIRNQDFSCIDCGCYGESPLHIAAANGRKTIVEFFLNEGLFVDDQNFSSETPLLLATQNGHKDIVEVLLKNKADTAIHDQHGYSPIYYAIKFNYTDIAKMLLNTNENVINETIINLTPLHLAANYGNLELVIFLLEKNVHVDAKGNEDFTPLHLAAFNGHREIVNALIINGADVTAADIYGYTPLQHAIYTGHEDIVNILLKHTDNVNSFNKIDGNSNLHLAAAYGHLGIVKTLLENGAKVNFPNFENDTPLHDAAYFGHSEICSVFIKHGVIIDARDKYNNTPLHYAAKIGHTEVVALLLKNGADLNARGRDDKTPLNFLNKNNAQVNTASNRGITPLRAQRGHGDATDLLVRCRNPRPAFRNLVTNAIHSMLIDYEERSRITRPDL